MPDKETKGVCLELVWLSRLPCQKAPDMLAGAALTLGTYSHSQCRLVMRMAIWSLRAMLLNMW